jgi:cell division protein FtsB
MNEQIVTIVVALISVLGGAGFWGWMQHKSKLAYEAMSAEKADKNEFRETLKVQVDRLADQVNQLFAEKENLLREVAELQAKVSAQAVTIQHLEERLRNR